MQSAEIPAQKLKYFYFVHSLNGLNPGTLNETLSVVLISFANFFIESVELFL